MTLAYEDGRQAEAHKVVLSLSNPCICQIILGFVPELFLHLFWNYCSICFEISLGFAMRSSSNNPVIFHRGSYIRCTYFVYTFLMQK